MPRLVRTVAAYGELRGEMGKVSFVPTMGALHEGHGSLVRAARAHGDTVVVSIFVNPTQFGPAEDLERYPRDLEGDLAKLANWGCDILFHPGAKDIYPQGLGAFRVKPPAALADFWCGASRPGHLEGVCTVVTKLLGLVRPEVALFGQKDFQQWRVIEAMAEDLALGVDILRCPTVREPDGLAMSSRNAYLTTEERLRARALSRALAHVLAEWKSGVRAVDRLEARGREAWSTATVSFPEPIDPEYLEVRPQDLSRAREIEGPGVVAMAARIGPTRLIDNVLLSDDSPDLPLLELLS